MATGSRTSKTTSDERSATRRQVLTYEQFVDDRLRKVRSYVKLRDLAAAMLLMVTGCLAIVALLVVIDHWCFDLGVIGRLCGFTVLVGWLTFCLITRLIPPLIKSVNPAYAAKVIEEGEPGLKNRLLNFVLFRAHRADLKEVVYQAVRQEAATELTHVEVESTVDYSRLVRFAAAMAALVMALGIYSAVSPKSLFTTLGRILAPWRSIARPARVLIDDVQPGTTQAYFGRSVTVSALIDRLPADERPWVVFSSVDQRVVDERLPMSLDKVADRYQTELPPNRRGLRQDLIYRLEAGDAIAGPYRIQVVPAPSIVVERVEYEFPAYTQLSPEIVEGEGDISAIEGTRVTIHASTNQTISSAYLEFDADNSSARPGRSSRPRKTVPLDHDGQQASVSFRLLLRQDGRTPVHSSYQLRFHNEQNEINSHPIRYHINVLPDLKPEVEILTPLQTEVDVPVNSAQAIEVRAFDPDFQLSQLTLKTLQLGRDGKRIETIELLEEPTAGQVAKRHLFRPQTLGLRPGQTVILKAMAGDNRHDPNTRKPKPNTAQTGDYRLHIVDAAKPDPETQTQRQNGEPPQEPEGGERSDERSSESEGSASENNGGQEGESGSPNAEGAEGGTDSTEANEGSEQSRRDANGGQSEAAERSGEGTSGPSDDRAGTGEQQQTGAAADRGESGSTNGTAAGEKSEGEEGEAAEGGIADGDQPSAMDDRGGQRQSDNGAERDGEGQDGTESAERGRDAVGRERSRDTSQSEDKTPLPSDGSQDADVFDRIMEQMKSSNDQATDSSPSEQQQQSETSQPREAADAERERTEADQTETAQAPSQSGEESETTDQDEAQSSDQAEEQQNQQDPNQAGSDLPTERQEAEQQASQQEQPGQDTSQQGGSEQGGSEQGGSEQQQGQPSPSQQQQAGEPSNQTGNQQGQDAEQTPDAERSRQNSDQQGEQGERQGGTSQGQSGQGQQGSGAQSGREPGGVENAAGAETGEPGQTGEGQSSSAEDGQPGTSSESGNEIQGQSSQTAEGMGERSGSSQNGSEGTSGQGEGQTGSDETGSESSANEAGRSGSPAAERGEVQQEGSSDSSDPQADDNSQRTRGQTPGQAEGEQPSEQSSDRNAADSGEMTEQPNQQAGQQAGQQADGQADGQAGEQAGQQAGEQAGQQSGQQPGGPESSQPSDQTSPSGATAGQAPGQGAERGQADPPPSRSNEGLPEPGGDAANLEYSRKATEMVLDYLKDQRDQPDPGLLDRLGWSEEDLNRFVNRWEQMQRAAQQPGQAGQESRRELDQALRSLGLQPRQDSTQTATDTADALTDVSDAGTRGRPPAQYRDAYKAFMQRRKKTGGQP